MHCLESCLHLRWHTDQLHILRRRCASQAEAARAYKTLLTKLQGKSGWGLMRWGGGWGCVWFCPVFAQQCVDVWLCVFELEGSCATAPWGQTHTQVKVLKSGTSPYQTPSFRAAQSQRKVVCVARPGLASKQHINLAFGAHIRQEVILTCTTNAIQNLDIVSS